MTGWTRINCGHPASVGSKCVRNSPCGSVRRVPKNTAFTAGLSSRYASRAGRMGSAYRLRSRWYCWADSATNSSTSVNGWLETMYIACRGRPGVGVVEDGEDSDLAVAVVSTPATSEVGRAAHSGRQASISTKRTRQSLPPLYERERCSGLASSGFESAGCLVEKGSVPFRR